MRHFVKWLAVITAVLLIGAGATIGYWMPAPASGAARDFEYKVRDDGVTITRYIGKGVNIAIPAKIAGKPVTRIGRAGTFCPLSAGCMGAPGAFQDCKSVTSVFIPGSVNVIEGNVFDGCAALISIRVDSGNANYADIGGALFDKDMTALVQYPIGKAGTYTIPGGVTAIADNAFAGCSKLTALTLPHGVTDIGDEAFMGCTGLTSLAIPDSVSTIGDAAFFGCTGLTSVTIPDSVQNLGGSVFADCTGLTSAKLPRGITNYDNTFSGCTGLKSFSVPAGTTSISGMFYGCTGLTSVALPNSMVHVGIAFGGCTSLTSIVIPDGATDISDSFVGCVRLVSVTIPDSVTNIDGAFDGCVSLTSVHVPKGVESLGYETFKGCVGLRSIYFEGGAPAMDYGSAFEQVSPDLTIYHPAGAAGWTNPWNGIPTAGYYKGNP